MERDKELCFEAGMDDYISKPIKANELYQIINKYGKVDLSKQNG
jgi:two-component system sensor histidine kinase/response regulator